MVQVPDGVRVHRRVGVVAVAVVVDVAARHLAGPGGGRRIPVAVGVGVPVPGEGVRCLVLVGLGVAVVVQAVAELHPGRVDGLVGVVAVPALDGGALGPVAGIDRAVRQAPVVPVGVDVEAAGDLLVDAAVAVVVALVADLLRAGEGPRVAVVAVLGVGDEALGWIADRLSLAGAEAVSVVVVVPGLDQLVVDLAVAVIVELVAALRCARVAVGVQVVAVVGVVDVPRRGLAGQDGVTDPEAVRVRVEVPGQLLAALQCGGVLVDGTGVQVGRAAGEEADQQHRRLLKGGP